MPSFQDMCEETLGLLTDWSGSQAQTCSLLSPITSTDLSFTVDDASAMSGRGLVEIDEELVVVKSLDPTAAIAMVPAWGRGQGVTTAAAHSAGARVTTAPRPPRSRIKQTLNQVVLGLYPDLWAVSSVELPATIAAEYPLPAAARWIVDLRWETPAAPSSWEKVRYWRVNTSANLVDFPTGVSVTVETVPVGQTIRIVWAGETTPMSLPGDDFAATTGLHAGVADLVVTAAAARLILGADLSRAQLGTVEQSDRNVVVPASAALTASRFLQQTYTVRVAAERRRLLATHPSRPHFEGV